VDSANALRVSGEEVTGVDVDDGKELDEGSHLRTRVDSAMNRALSIQEK
jgi:hypothetical protein